jgi:hypothetical protein
VRRVRGRRARRARVQVGAPDESLTRFSGLTAVTELCDRLAVIDRLDDAVGPIKPGIAGSARGRCWSGWPRRSCAARTSWSGSIDTAPTPPGRCSHRCRGWRPRPPPGWPRMGGVGSLAAQEGAASQGPGRPTRSGLGLNARGSVCHAIDHPSGCPCCDQG